MAYFLLPIIEDLFHGKHDVVYTLSLNRVVDAAFCLAGSFNEQANNLTSNYFRYRYIID